MYSPAIFYEEGVVKGNQQKAAPFKGDRKVVYKQLRYGKGASVPCVCNPHASIINISLFPSLK
jgi:hypothetical protein